MSPTLKTRLENRTFFILIPLYSVATLLFWRTILSCMRILFKVIILIGLLSACAVPTASPTPLPIVTPTELPLLSPFASQDTLTGMWLGGFSKPDGAMVSLSLNFEGSTGNLTIEPKVKIWPTTSLTQEGDRVHFVVTGKAGEDFEQIEFTGKLSDGTLQGDLNLDGQISPTTFTPISAVETSVLEKYVGVYRFESGRVLSILNSPKYDLKGLHFFHNGLAMTDFKNGSMRGLYSLEDFTFAVGALRVVGAPLQSRIQFITDEQGNATGLIWWDELDGVKPSAESGQYAPRLLFHSEDITFTSAAGTTLAGRISLPESNSPLPAFMMLHGSEQGTRDNFGNQVMAHYMLSRGFAILNYDKRGVGESGGTYQEAASASNLQKLAEDAVAGVEYLASRPDIDAERIGLIGGSQAGWIIPISASESDRIAFFVILSGPVVSVSHEDLYSSYTNDGDSLVTYDAEKLNQTLREKAPSGFDPLPVITELSQPGLWLWGSVDKSVPVTVSAENLQALIDSGKSNFSYTIFPGGDHNLNISTNGLFAEIPYSPGLLFYSTLTEWLEKTVQKE